MPPRLWLILTCLLLAACQAPPVKAPVGDHSERPSGNPGYHRVSPGDTLYSVAFMYGYSVAELAAWNGLKNPYTIYKGQQLRLSPPPVPTRTARRLTTAAKPAPEPSRPKPRRVSRPQPKQQAAPVPTVSRKPAPKPSPRQSAAPAPRQLSWSWPLRGRLLQRYDARSSVRKGINIAGKSGDSVRAAAAGKVVYSGSGLSGYGRLIIIKHNEEFLSAYAHNRTLVAREGQWVEKGDVIARVGSSGTDRPQLHFEIRKHGRPVDPLRHLPRR